MLALSLLALLSVVPASMAALRGSSASLQSYGSSKSFAAKCIKGGFVEASKDELQEIAYSVRDQINELVAPMDTKNRANLFATAYKLALHDAAEVDLRSNDQLGSDGCLSFTDANEDLIATSSVVNTVIEPMWQKYCDKMSRADFWVLFAKLALEKADGSHSLILPFQYGRKDAKECGVSTSRLMDNQRGEDDFFRVFLQQMQLSVSDAVTLMGARSVGYHSGSAYSWDETPAVLDNGYFKLLGQSSWKDVVVGSKNYWVQIEAVPVTPSVDSSAAAVVAEEESAAPVAQETLRRRAQEVVSMAQPSDFVTVESSVAMLNTDMALAYPIETSFSFYYRTYVSREDDMCGPTMVEEGTEHGCVGGGEETVGWPFYTFDQVKKYAENNKDFIGDFANAFERMTTVGYNVAGRVIEEGKFGTLTQLSTISNSL